VDEFFAISDLLKATPQEEGGERFIYFEASNEALDQQGEVVLAKALAESREYYERYGNVDIDHYTQIGAKAGIRDYHLFEIGRPVRAEINGKRTFVKAQLYQGDSPVAAKANDVWDSLTAISPPQRWYPSVGGQVLEKAQEFGEEGARSVVKRVRWTNVALSKTPVNTDVPEVTTVPFGVLAKCMVAGSIDWSKALEAGYGSNVAQLEGGGALRVQSLDRRIQKVLPVLDYYGFRERLAGDIRAKRAQKLSGSSLISFSAQTYGLDHNRASKWVTRFLSETAARLTPSRRHSQ
jgi:hypothetical protein